MTNLHIQGRELTVRHHHDDLALSSLRSSVHANKSLDKKDQKSPNKPFLNSNNNSPSIPLPETPPSISLQNLLQIQPLTFPQIRLSFLRTGITGKYLDSNYTSLSWVPYGDHWRNLRRISSLEVPYGGD